MHKCFSNLHSQEGGSADQFPLASQVLSAVSIETVSQIASVVGCWLKCGIKKLHLTIVRIFKAATVNHYKDTSE